MSKKILNLLAFLAVLAGCIAMTVFTGKGSVSTMIYNFVFLAIMTVLYLAGMLGGMFRVEGIGQALHRGKEELTGIFKTPGKVKNESLVYLKGIFDHKYLDGRLDDFVDGMNQAKEGIGEIEDYINEDDIDLHVHKRILEMIPDIFTSLGILGTFIGLVWGLKNFEPSSYETMTNSVSSLVAGIKVAFLTSIYGIAFAIIYTSGMKSVFSDMNEKLQAFLEKFHIYVLPTAENESRNLMVASQKLQVKAMKQMAEQLSAEMAQSFEKAINPTFQKMNESLDVLTESVTSCQQDVMQEILRSFLREMNGSFKLQFKDFNDALAQLKKAQKENTDYTTNLYHTMSDQLNSSYEKQSETMKDMVNELGNAQGRYISTASRIAQENQEIQRVADYLKEAEKTSAKFWVACNQTMQRYVETASQGMEKVSAASQTGTDVLNANRQVMEELEKRLADFASCQDKTLQTMEEVRRLLTDISVTKENGNISLTGGQQNLNASRMADRQSMDRLYALMKEQGEKQEALLEEMNRNLGELSKTPQKGKFGLFR